MPPGANTRKRADATAQSGQRPDRKCKKPRAAAPRSRSSRSRSASYPTAGLDTDAVDAAADAADAAAAAADREPSPRGGMMVTAMESNHAHADAFSHSTELEPPSPVTTCGPDQAQAHTQAHAHAHDDAHAHAHAHAHARAHPQYAAERCPICLSNAANADGPFSADGDEQGHSMCYSCGNMTCGECAQEMLKQWFTSAVVFLQEYLALCCLADLISDQVITEALFSLDIDDGDIRNMIEASKRYYDDVVDEDALDRMCQQERFMHHARFLAKCLEKCPICRAPHPASDFETIALLESLLEKREPGRHTQVAQLYLGNIHADAQEYSKALGWFQKAAELGDVRAMYNLADMHCMGSLTYGRFDDSVCDAAVAVRWFKQAADLDYAPALVEHALHLDGIGRHDEAKRCLLRSVEQGYVPAYLALAARREHGLYEGLPSDPAEGRQYLERAVELGNSRAQGMLRSRRRTAPMGWRRSKDSSGRLVRSSDE